MRSSFLKRPLGPMIFGLAALLFLGSSPAFAASPPPVLPEVDTALRGRSIAAVELDAPVGEAAHELLGLIDIQPGYLLTKSDVEAAIERLYALGRFSQVDAFVLPLDEAVILRFVLKPIVHLERLRIVGVRPARLESLQRALALGSGDTIDSRTQAHLKQRAQAHLARVGFALAQITIETSPGSGPNTRVMVLRVEEGPATRLSQIHIEGHPRVPKSVILRAMRSRPGAVLDEEQLDQDKARIAQELQNRGFLRAQVGAAKITHVPDGAHITFQIDAFERLGFRFSGIHALSKKQLIALWPGTQSNPPEANVGLFRRRIEEALARLSYTQAKVHVRLVRSPKPKPRHMIRDATVWVHVEEGAPLWVEDVVLQGHPILPRDIIINQLTSLLTRDLEDTNFFSPLDAGTWPTHLGPQLPLEHPAAQIPPNNRWVPELYNQAAEDIALALRELGYTEAIVSAPVLKPLGEPEDRSPSKDHSERWPAEGVTVDTASLMPPSGRLSQNGPQKPRNAQVLLHIEPKQQHFIDSITFHGAEAVSATQLLGIIRKATSGHALRAPLAPGAPLSWQAIEDGRIAIVRALRDVGHHYARVVVEVTGEAQTQAKLTFRIEEGPPVTIAHVLIRGNHHTRQGIIRSRMSLAQNKRYRLPDAVADQRDIMALGTFGAVRVRLTDEEHAAGEKDVVVEVEERPRQPIEVVPGISTASGPRLRLAYSHINVAGTASVFVAALRVNRQVFFPLYGRFAETLRERYGAYQGWQQLTRAIEREIRVGLRSPPIKHLPFDPLLRLDVVDQRINAVRYGLDAATATFGIDMVPAHRFTLSLEVQGGITNLECPLEDACNLNPEIRRLRGGYPIQEGRRHTLKFGPRLIYEGRNSPISPSRGLFVSGRVTQAIGAAAPEQVMTPFAFLKWEGQAITYVPLWKATLALSVRAGSIDIQRDAVPVDERFFLGGRDTLRGFVETTLIPEDACVVADPAAPLPPHCLEGIAKQPGQPPLSLGGNTFALLKTELRLPLRDQFSLDLFADLGNLWVGLLQSDRYALRVGTGLGLRYASPVGALTIDFGVNPHPRRINEEARWQIHFSIGSF